MQRRLKKLNQCAHGGTNGRCSETAKCVAMCGNKTAFKFGVHCMSLKDMQDYIAVGRPLLAIKTLGEISLTVGEVSERKGVVIGKIMNAELWEFFPRMVDKTATSKKKSFQMHMLVQQFLQS